MEDPPTLPFMIRLFCCDGAGCNLGGLSYTKSSLTSSAWKNHFAAKNHQLTFERIYKQWVAHRFPSFLDDNVEYPPLPVPPEINEDPALRSLQGALAIPGLTLIRTEVPINQAPPAPSQPKVVFQPRPPPAPVPDPPKITVSGVPFFSPPPDKCECTSLGMKERKKKKYERKLKIFLNSEAHPLRSLPDLPIPKRNICTPLLLAVFACSLCGTSSFLLFFFFSFSFSVSSLLIFACRSIAIRNHQMPPQYPERPQILAR